MDVWYYAVRYGVAVERERKNTKEQRAAPWGRATGMMRDSETNGKKRGVE